MTQNAHQPAELVLSFFPDKLDNAVVLCDKLAHAHDLPGLLEANYDTDALYCRLALADS